MPPVLAVRYQILIFVLLVTSTTVSTLLFLFLVRARYLTPAHQLRAELLETAPARSPRERRRS